MGLDIVDLAFDLTCFSYGCDWMLFLVFIIIAIHLFYVLISSLFVSKIKYFHRVTIAYAGYN